MLSLGCRDTGAGVLGCDYVVEGETEEELWRNGTEHLIKVHGMKAEDITPQFTIDNTSNITKIRITSPSFDLCSISPQMVSISIFSQSINVVF